MRTALLAAMLLCMPGWSLAEPFEVVVSTEVEVLIGDSSEQVQVPWGWLLPAGDGVQGTELEGIRLTHQSSEPAVSFDTKIEADSTHTYRPGEAIGEEDLVVLAALAPSGVRPTQSKARWNALVRFPPSWAGECVLTTTVQFGEDEARFKTKIRISRREPGYIAPGILRGNYQRAVRILKAQRLRSSASGDPEVLGTADLTWTPPDSELRANRQELEYLRIHDLDNLDTASVRFRLWNANIHDVAKLIEQMTGLPVEVDDRLRGRQVTFVTYPMEPMDLLLLFGHRESLRYVADGYKLRLLPDEDR